MPLMKKMLFAIAAPLLLSGCLLLPGKFDASLRLMKDGSYDFEYVGEMQMFAEGEKDMTSPEKEPFDPAKAHCTTIIDGAATSRTSEYRYWQDDDTTKAEAAEAADAFEAVIDGDYQEIERDCTDEELADLREQEQKRFERKTREYEKNAGMMSAMFGGAIPGNDEALTEFASNLAKYDGWDKVEYVGDNKFAVEYRASGRFDRYFAFPVLPDAASQFPFFHIVPRGDGRLEILSPALGGTGKGGNMMALMMAGMAGEKDAPNLSEVSGTFTLETDGTISANNAPDGFVEDAEGVRTMRWDVGAGNDAAPRALIQLDR